MVECAPHMVHLFSLGEGRGGEGGGMWGFIFPFCNNAPLRRGVWIFVLQQECICNTCKSELMFDFDLAPYNLATYHLALVFHITCV